MARLALTGRPKSRPRRMRRRSRLAAILRNAARSPKGSVGLALVGGVALIGFAGPAVAPHSPFAIVAAPFSRPSSGLLLGGDDLGRDVLSRVLAGGRVLLWMSLAATAAAVATGSALGIVSAYRGGWVETVVMRAVDVLLALPTIVLALLVVSVLGTKLWLVVAAVALGQAPPVARVIQAATLDITERDYIRYSEALGDPGRSIMMRDILPNLVSPLAVEFGLRLTWSAITLASLAFLGFGQQPPAANWGVMISENLIGLVSNPWSVLAPAAIIAMFCIGTNLYTDAVARSAGLATADLTLAARDEALVSSAGEASPSASVVHAPREEEVGNWPA
jgi:peptide/nickel transport system permease protein